MHSERSGPPDWRALQLVGDRVVGLGAPVSVRLRVPVSDITLLRAQILAEIERHEAEMPTGTTPRHGTVASAIEQWKAERRAWEDMVRRLDNGDAYVDVTWPSAYAAPVLRGAVAAAEAAVAAAPGDAVAVAALDSARMTLDAFLGVDNGGLEDVSL